jgi:hypothetical protein
MLMEQFDTMIEKATEPIGYAVVEMQKHTLKPQKLIIEITPEGKLDWKFQNADGTPTPPRDYRTGKKENTKKSSYGYYRQKIKIPRSTLPLFQRLYPIITAKNGEVIFDGKELFNERYEIVEDQAWQTMDSAEIAAPYLKKIEHLGEKQDDPNTAPK